MDFHNYDWDAVMVDVPLQQNDEEDGGEKTCFLLLVDCLTQKGPLHFFFAIDDEVYKNPNDRLVLYNIHYHESLHVDQICLDPEFSIDAVCASQSVNNFQ